MSVEWRCESLFMSLSVELSRDPKEFTQGEC
jgi:hypothetical protein